MRFALAVLMLSACSAASPKKYVAAPTTAVSATSDIAFASPWPDDRLLVDGTFPALAFPVGDGGQVVSTLLGTADHLIAGWGLASPIFIPFSGAIDPATLNQTSVQLIVVDPLSPYYRQRARIDWQFTDAPTTYLSGHALAVRPIPGFPLEPKTRYALIITSDVHDVAGQPIGPDRALFDALTDQGDAANHVFYAPLFELAAHENLDVTKIAGATIFTTQPVLDEFLSLRDFVAAQPAPEAGNLAALSTSAHYDVFEGTYQAPNLQHGTPPYLQTGGDFQYDANGTPTVGVVETMSFAVAVPKGPVPAGGFPLVIYSHGTGGDYTSFVGDIADDLAVRGIASLGIDQVLADHRIQGLASTTGCLGAETDYCFFNPFNAAAGRNNSRQSALDNVSLRRMLPSLILSASLAGRTVTFDLTHLGFFGHSQGGITGALYAAIDPQLAGAVISGTGGYITNTIIVRTYPIDLSSVLHLLLGLPSSEVIDPYHPALALLQTLAEVSDPLNYSRYWVQRPLGRPKNLYITSGLLDLDTPPIAVPWMCAAGGIPPLAPIFKFQDIFDAASLSLVDRPVNANVSGVTAVFRQFENRDHFAVFDDPSAHADWSTFLDAVVHTGTGALPP